ncbi:MAG: hypothetical protein PF572_06070 [Patescibacteria group bacterium]|jgi:phenylpyruvate tautomerase PptA (4-oxalocrotonate tautomerase family)|nr:hypothetical protein [Patescibacteria group bacterium]
MNNNKSDNLSEEQKKQIATDLADLLFEHWQNRNIDSKKHIDN